MPYNQILAQRIHAILGGSAGVSEKKMFGGVGFMVHGNMACGVLGDDLIARVGPELHTAAMAKPFVRSFLSPRGEPMAGWVLVSPEGWQTEEDLLGWVRQGYEYASSLPEKKKA